MLLTARAAYPKEKTNDADAIVILIKQAQRKLKKNLDRSRFFLCVLWWRWGESNPRPK